MQTIINYGILLVLTVSVGSQIAHAQSDGADSSGVTKVVNLGDDGCAELCEYLLPADWNADENRNSCEMCMSMDEATGEVRDADGIITLLPPPKPAVPAPGEYYASALFTHERPAHDLERGAGVHAVLHDRGPGPPQMQRSPGVDCRPAMCVTVCCRQGIYVEYSVKYSKCCALNGILASTVDDCESPLAC
eukprot:9468147-Pyramimonas_sp.AAC.2